MSYFERLKNARLAMNFSQRKLAELAKIAPASLNAYEKGDKKPSVDIAYRLAKILGVSLDWLFNEEMTKEQSSVNARSEGDIARAIHILCASGIWSGVKMEAEPVEWELEGDIHDADAEPEWLAFPKEYFEGAPEEYRRFDPNGYCGTIHITNHNLSSFIGGYQKLLELYKSNDIDWDMLSAWVNKKLIALDQIPILHNVDRQTETLADYTQQESPNE